MWRPAPPPHQTRGIGDDTTVIPVGDDTNDDGANARATARAHWRAWCARLAELGDSVLDDPLVTDERAAADGLRHLTRQLVFATQWHVEFDDPERPRLYRYDDDATSWGGPNADNTYLRTRIDPSGTYRLRADVTGCRELIVGVSEGDMQLGLTGVYAEACLADLHLAGGRLDLIVSPEPPITDDGRPFVGGALVGGVPVDWLPTHPDATLLSIRVYVADWDRDRVPDFTIERLDHDPGAPPPARIDALADRLERAVDWMAVSVPFWLRYVEGARAGLPVNTFMAPHHPPGGALNIAYGAGFWELDDDTAWLITVDPPDAFHWSVQTHTWPWFESGDFTHRRTSLNDTDVHVDGDGRVRIVVSSRDPGVPNWLDTEGRRTGLVVHRWVRSRDEPTPRSVVTPLDQLTEHLPDDHPVVSPDERRRQLARRRLAVQRRFRR